MITGIAPQHLLRAQAIEQALRALANPDVAAPMRAYMKNQLSFLGIQAATRRAAVAALGAWRPPHDELLATAHALWALPEREFRYAAVDALARHHKRLSLSDLPVLLALAQREPWWDTVDALAGVVGDVLKAALPTSPDAQTCMDQALHHPSLWVRRIAMLHQLGWREATDTSRVFAYAQALAPDTDFFMRKAIGWALRDLARTQPERVRQFVDEHATTLSPLTRREATKHI